MAAIIQTDNDDVEVCWGRGDSDPKSFEIRLDGVVQDVSGWTFIMSVDELEDPVGVATQKFTLVGSFVTDGTDGLVAFTPTPSETDITPQSYFYDIQRKIGGSSVKTLIKGVVSIVQDITKA